MEHRFARSLRSLALVTTIATCLPLAASSAAAQAASPGVTITIHVDAAGGAADEERAPARPDAPSEEGSPSASAPRSAPGTLRLLSPEDVRALHLGTNVLRPPTADPGGDALALTILSGVLFGASVVGLAAVASELPSFGEEWPEWAAITLGLSLPYAAAGLWGIGAGLGIAAGDDGIGVLAVAGGIELALALVMGAAAIAIAPGVGRDWDDRTTQAHATEMLGLGAMTFGIVGGLGVLLGSSGEPAGESPTHDVAVAPIVTPTTIGVRASGRF